jgi:hypothetical protein
MAKFEKLIARFLAKPKDFRYDELKNLLRQFNYEEVKTGRTAGSRRKFAHKETKHVIGIHEPHDGKLKHYQLDDVENALRDQGLI